LNVSDKQSSVDGRFIVVICVLSGLLLYDVTFDYLWSLLTAKQENIFCQQLCFVDPNKLVIKKCLEEEMEAVPASYAPFLFEPIPINSADKDMLMTVKGIGPALAESIVLYREKFGPIKNSQELQNLHGIGVRRAVKLTKFITFKEVQ